MGAGPAGSTCAYQLRHSGLNVILIDKAKFPRDKVCGDALSPDVYNQLGILSPTLQHAFSTQTLKFKTTGIQLYAPDESLLQVNYTQFKGYVATRYDFDTLLFEHAAACQHVTALQNQTLQAAEINQEEVTVTTDDYQITGKWLLGADGANSGVRRLLFPKPESKKGLAAGIRQYYQGVSQVQHHGCIELHFNQTLMPGYMWIFPLPNGKANVGLGMPFTYVSKHKLNLKTLLPELIEETPSLKQRFANAKPLEKPIGFGLPTGSRKVTCSRERVLLLGDAAHLIDPFTGEGIGNAIRSGRIAADHLINGTKTHRSDGTYNKQYDRELYRRMGKELKIGTWLQQLARYPKLMNKLIKKANNNSAIQELLTASLANATLKDKLSDPRFYFRLLFT